MAELMNRQIGEETHLRNQAHRETDDDHPHKARNEFSPLPVLRSFGENIVPADENAEKPGNSSAYQ